MDFTFAATVKFSAKIKKRNNIPETYISLNKLCGAIFVLRFFDMSSVTETVKKNASAGKKKQPYFLLAWG